MARPQHTPTEGGRGAALNVFITAQYKKVAWTFVVLLLVVGYFFVVRPERAQLLEKVTNDITRVKQEKDIKEATLNRLKRQLNEFAIVQEHNREILERMLPPITRTEEAMFSLNAVLSSLNFYITSLQVEDPITPEEYFGSKLDVPLAMSIVPVSATITGQTITYEKIKALLNAFHERYGIFNIKELELEEDTGTTGSRGEDEMTLSIDLFFTDDTATQQ